MSVIKKSDPLRDLLQIQEQINKLFEDRLKLGPAERLDLPIAHGSFSPPLDVYETEEAFFVHAELPGIRREDVQVSIEGAVLTLRGERKRPTARRVENEAGNGRFH